MAVNKVEINGQTAIDLTQDTVTPGTLQKGYTAHDKSGTKITGTLEPSSSGGGSTSETWVLNENCELDSIYVSGASFQISFTSNGLSYETLSVSDFKGITYYLNYGETLVCTANIGFGTTTPTYTWESPSYRKLTFNTPPTGDLLTWLQENGVKQPANLAVQPSKDVTITSNGTTEITPDAPYDVMEKANVTVAVEQTAGFKVTFPATADANWAARVAAARLLKSDGTFVNFTDYSVVAGKSVSNVIAITIPTTNRNYVARYTFSGGMLGIDGGLLNMTNTPFVRVENSPSYTPYYGGDRYWHVFTADTVITKLEIYDTD